MTSRTIGVAVAGLVALALCGLAVLLVKVTSGEEGSLAHDRALLDGVDGAIAALAPGGACAQLDALLATTEAAAAGLDGKVRERPVAAFAGMIRDQRAACTAALAPRVKEMLVTTWASVRVTVGRSAESLSGGVPTAAP